MRAPNGDFGGGLSLGSVVLFRCVQTESPSGKSKGSEESAFTRCRFERDRQEIRSEYRNHQELAVEKKVRHKMSNRKRRGRGEASIFERADGQWVGSISLGYHESGKRKR